MSLRYDGRIVVRATTLGILYLLPGIATAAYAQPPQIAPPQLTERVDVSRVVVDVSGLRLIDSLGVGAVVFLYKQAKEYGGVVTVHGLHDQPLAIFKLLGLDRVLLA